MVIKSLIPAEYHILALILARVVLIIEHILLGLILRTLLYSSGVLVVLTLGKGIRGTDAAHVRASIICVAGALLVWNAAGVVERHLGKRQFAKLVATPIPPNTETPTAHA